MPLHAYLLVCLWPSACLVVVVCESECVGGGLWCGGDICGRYLVFDLGSKWSPIYLFQEIERDRSPNAVMLFAWLGVSGKMSACMDVLVRVCMHVWVFGCGCVYVCVVCRPQTVTMCTNRRKPEDDPSPKTEPGNFQKKTLVVENTKMEELEKKVQLTLALELNHKEISRSTQTKRI